MAFCRGWLLVFLGLACCPRIGHAEDTVHMFKGESLRLPTPAGFCVPDPNNPSDAFFIKAANTLFAQMKITVVKVAVACEQLRKRRADYQAPIYDYIVYYYPDSTLAEPYRGDTASFRKFLCDAIRNANAPNLERDVNQGFARAAAELKSNTIALSGTKPLGVLAEDSHGCYSGLLSSVTSNNGTTLMAENKLSTVVHRKSVFVSIYSRYQSPAESEKTLLLEQAIAAQMDRDNPE